MMLNLIKTTDPAHRPLRTRQEAARVLEELRAAYQSLSSGKRTLIRISVMRATQAQLTQERAEENECFELAF